MLQWMGGSRRKVTASRKSVQKRQKQYFEQKRRQQHQQAVGLEESTEGGLSKWEQTQKEHHSLDVLNLLNFSAATRGCSPDFPCNTVRGRENLKFNASPIKHHTARDERMIQGSLPAYQVETLLPNKALHGSLDDPNNSLGGAENKTDVWNAATQQQASVFDLLSDDESNEYVEEGSAHEAHVAFSVDGLGKVGTETPPQSPQQPGRHISHGFFSPSKASRKLNSSRNCSSVLNDLELEVDTIMQDLEILGGGSSLEFSTGIEDSYSKLKKNLSAVRDPMQFHSQGGKVRSSFPCGQTFYDTGNSFEDLWDGRSSLLEANFLDQRERDVSWKNWTPRSDVDIDEFLNCGEPYHTSGGPHLLKKRDATKAAERFNFLDSPPVKHRKAENDIDFSSCKGTGHFSTRRTVNIEDVAEHPDWSSFILDKSRESPTMLSEESCSSTAVWGQGNDNSVKPGKQ